MTIRITNTFLEDDAVQTRNIKDGAVTSSKYASGSVNAAALGSESVTGPKLGSAAVGTANIADQAVTAPKLADDAVTNPKLADDAVGTPNIIDAAITSVKLGSSAVVTGSIADGAVTNPKLATGAVNTANLMDAAVSLEKLGVSPVLQGVHTVWMPAKAITPSVVNGALPVDNSFSSSTKPTFGSLSFPKAYVSYTDFNIVWPKSWDKGSVTFTVYWMPGTTTGGCVWGIGHRHLQAGNSINQSYTYSATTTSTALTASTLYISSPMSITISASTAEQIGFFSLYRSTSDAGDTMTGAAILIGVLVKYNVNGVNDA